MKTVNVELARRLITGIIGLGIIGFGLLLVGLGLLSLMVADCQDADGSACVIAIVLPLAAGAVYGVLGMPVLVAVQSPGAVPPTIVAVCITLAIGGPASVWGLGYGGSEYGALVALTVLGSFFLGYFVAPREVDG